MNIRRCIRSRKYTISCTCLLVVFILMCALSSTTTSWQPYLTSDESWQQPYLTTHVKTAQVPEVSYTKKMKTILKEQQEFIENEMKQYKFKNHKIKSLKALTPASGGRPLQHILLTSWRSGSTFLGDVLDTHPGNWYFYEPFSDLEIVKIRGSPQTDNALKTIRQLLNCNYTNIDTESYMNFTKKHNFVLQANQRLWKYCKDHRELCKNPQFLTDMCKLFPIHSMKTVRLRLNVVEQLLKDKQLGAKIVLLVRDPRGTMRSRQERAWCQRSPDCADPALHCADLAADFISAKALVQRYPDNFRAIRYEDFFLNLTHATQNLLNFLDLDMVPDIVQYIDSHTKVNKGNWHSTFRDSKSTTFKWKTEASFKSVAQIQDVCGQAMEFWGYVPAKNETHLKKFTPITSFKL